jgi:hypothetical protein
LLQLAAGLFLLTAAISLLRTRARRRVFGGIVALSAILQASFLVGRQAVRVGLPPSQPIDPVDLAVWLGIALMAAFGALWAEVLTNAEHGGDSPDAADRLERRISPAAFRAVVWLAVAFGLVVTGVPAAVIAAGVVTVVLLAMAIGRRRGDLARRVGVVLILALLLGGGTIGAKDEPGEERSGRMLPADVWRTSVETWQQFPFVGSGFGTFPEAFRRVQPRAISGLVDRARSAPLELLVTGGIFGFVLGALGIVALLVCQLRAWRSQRHREESAIALAGFGGLLFWLLAGLAESSTQSLAPLPLLASVVGAGWAASQARGGRIV